MHVGVVTLFPNLIEAFAETSIVGRAIEADLISMHVEDLRVHGVGKYKSVDDTPYGGGSGMVLRVDCVMAAMDAAEAALQAPKRPLRVLLTPQGEPFTQRAAERLAAHGAFILTCGRYEGFDERIRGFVDLEISLGDFVMAGGEVAAMAIVEATARLVPGVLGDPESIVEESFTDALLEYPHYTRPAEVRGMPVPEVLLSGHHEAIRLWRRKEALRSTYQRRPDLLQDRVLSLEDQQLLDELTREGVPGTPVRCGEEG